MARWNGWSIPVDCGNSGVGRKKIWRSESKSQGVVGDPLAVRSLSRAAKDIQEIKPNALSRRETSVCPIHETISL